MSQNGLVSQLTRKQALFVEALLAGANLTIAATTAHVSYSTAKRWQALPAVAEALKSGQDELFESSLEELKGLMPKAIGVLIKHMDADVEVTAATQASLARA